MIAQKHNDVSRCSINGIELAHSWLNTCDIFHEILAPLRHASPAILLC
jgi:hypothetical protein